MKYVDIYTSFAYGLNASFPFLHLTIPSEASGAPLAFKIVSVKLHWNKTDGVEAKAVVTQSERRYYLP
jgi:hypothetical protein